MSEQSGNKYKMFRNFMVNELSITREDIKTWTKEAVAEEVLKIVGQIDIEGIIRITAKSNDHEIKRMIAREVADSISKGIKISFGDNL